MKLKTIAENTKQNGSSVLPEVPEGIIRFTHRTSRQNAEEIIRSGLKYKEDLDSTTDLIGRDNKHIAHIIKTGKAGAYDRNKFGDTVILIDISREEYRDHVIGGSLPGTVDQSRIVGYVNASTGEFTPNKIYNPTKNVKIGEISNTDPKSRIKQSQLPIPIPQSTGINNEVW